MSYCRSGPTSDIYIFGSGKYLEAYINKTPAFGKLSIAEYYEIPDSYSFECDDSASAELKMLGLIAFLRGLGLRIPDYADAMLKEEIMEALNEILD